MVLRLRAVLLSIGVLAASAMPAAAQYSVAGIDDPKLVETFVSKLQKAVAADDAAAVAALAHFPVDVTVDRKRRNHVSSDEFQKLYRQIFDPCLKRVVAAATIEDLFVNWKGVSLGQGAIWFGMQPDKTVRWFAINGPVDGEPLCERASLLLEMR
jgi:hypothetical protein